MSNHKDSPVSDVAWRNPDREDWCTCCGHRHVKAAEAFDPGEHIEFIIGTHVACLHRDGLPMVPLTAEQVRRAMVDEPAAWDAYLSEFETHAASCRLCGLEVTT